MTVSICSGAEAMAAVKDNDLVASHMWGLCGTPGHLYRALAASAVKDLTLYIENFLPGPPGFADLGYPDPVMLVPHIKKIITPFLGGRAYSRAGVESNFLGDLMRNGKLETEATTHGVFLERLHAGAMGLGGFYSPVGLGTVVAKGKEVRMIDGKEYIFETPVRPDVGLVKAARADKLGNLVYHGSARGANPVIAMASKVTIAEVDEIVEPGDLDPEEIVTPGIYVDYIVKIPEDDIAGARKQYELVKLAVTLMNR
ncbi:MAG: 3-oxoacid CoA-transferase subunit A [Dehalococcoidia bacterium]|jgi:3-oxoacid CoA-transferase A subunit